MFETRAPCERQINSFKEPFDYQITPYNFTDFNDYVKNFCKKSENQCNLRIGKIIFLGDMGVGKTSLINRCRDLDFVSNCKSTIGVDIHLEGFDVLGVPFNIQIWDTAGQERFRSISSTYFRGTTVVVLVFDLTNVDSLLHCEQWLDMALRENNSNQSLYVVVVGNKLDTISTSVYDGVKQIAAPLAKKLNAEYWAVSSKTGLNVKNFFLRLAFLTFECIILKEIKMQGEQNSSGFKLDHPPEKPGNNNQHKCAC